MKPRGYMTLTRIVLAFSMVALLTGSQVWRDASSDYEWSFPKDDWAHHEYRIEWWYFTGHLKDQAAADYRFGYQFTFYRIGLSPGTPLFVSRWSTRSMIMGHAAITDFESGEHVFTEILYRAMPFLGGFGEYPDPLIAWAQAPIGSDGRWELVRTQDGFQLSMSDSSREIGFHLKTTPDKPRLFHGPNGLSRKGESGASLYFGYSRLATEGVLAIGGREYAVSGESWMDREFSSGVLSATQQGWDWFSVQLDDGRELMVYQLRNAQGALDFGRGTLVAVDGEAIHLRPEDWTLIVDGSSPNSAGDGSYPSSWSLEVPDYDLAISLTPRLLEQENRSNLLPGLNYWEGAVEVRDPQGVVIGKGFVEMTGYAKGSRPPI